MPAYARVRQRQPPPPAELILIELDPVTDCAADYQRYREEADNLFAHLLKLSEGFLHDYCCVQLRLRFFHQAQAFYCPELRLERDPDEPPLTPAERRHIEWRRAELLAGARTELEDRLRAYLHQLLHQLRILSGLSMDDRNVLRRGAVQEAKAAARARLNARGEELKAELAEQLARAQAAGIPVTGDAGQHLNTVAMLELLLAQHELNREEKPARGQAAGPRLPRLSPLGPDPTTGSPTTASDALAREAETRRPSATAAEADAAVHASAGSGGVGAAGGGVVPSRSGKATAKETSKSAGKAACTKPARAATNGTAANGTTLDSKMDAVIQETLQAAREEFRRRIICEVDLREELEESGAVAPGTAGANCHLNRENSGQPEAGTHTGAGAGGSETSPAVGAETESNRSSARTGALARPGAVYGRIFQSALHPLEQQPGVVSITEKLHRLFGSGQVPDQQLDWEAEFGGNRRGEEWKYNDDLPPPEINPRKFRKLDPFDDAPEGCWNVDEWIWNLVRTKSWMMREQELKNETYLPMFRYMLLCTSSQFYDPFIEDLYHHPLKVRRWHPFVTWPLRSREEKTEW